MSTERMHADEVDTDVSLVRRLLEGQFPEWADLPIEPVGPFGTDNALYRLGDDMVARLPRTERTSRTLKNERRWLQRLAPLLPLAVPVPLAEGMPAEGYPFAWSVYTWLKGESATVARITDPAQLATDLAPCSSRRLGDGWPRYSPKLLSSRTVKRLVRIALPLALLIAGAVALLVRGSGAEPGLVGLKGGPFRGSTTPGSIRLPAFTLREWNGRRVDSRSLHGKVVLVTFLETKCQEACPIIADQIGMGLERLSPPERNGVYALAISTHPRDDTPASVREFLRVHRVVGRLHYLIGSETRLRPVWRSFHILAALDSGDADTHSAPVRIFDRNGTWVSTLHPGVDLTPANLAHDVRVAIRNS